MAEFVGLTNRIDGRPRAASSTCSGRTSPLLEGSVDSGPVKALVRPENVRLTRADDGTARVVAVSFLGSLCRAQVTMPDESLVVAQMSATDANELAPGTAVSVSVVPAPVFAVAD